MPPLYPLHSEEGDHSGSSYIREPRRVVRVKVCALVTEVTMSICHLPLHSHKSLPPQLHCSSHLHPEVSRAHSPLAGEEKPLTGRSQGRKGWSQGWWLSLPACRLGYSKLLIVEAGLLGWISPWAAALKAFTESSWEKGRDWGRTFGGERDISSTLQGCLSQWYPRISLVWHWGFSWKGVGRMMEDFISSSLKVILSSRRVCMLLVGWVRKL